MTRILGGRSAAGDVASARLARTATHTRKMRERIGIWRWRSGVLFGRLPDVLQQEFDGSPLPFARRIANPEDAAHANLVTSLLDGLGVLGAVVRVTFVIQGVVAVAGAKPNGRIVRADQAQHINVSTKRFPACPVHFVERRQPIERWPGGLWIESHRLVASQHVAP